MNERVILVACDGADGRIMAMLSEKLTALGMKVAVLVMTGGRLGEGGAENLFKSENRDAVYVSSEDVDTIKQCLQGAGCVISGHPCNRWELSPVVMQLAFESQIPVIRVCDHSFWNYDNNRHPDYVPGIIQTWKNANKPPFILTAVNNAHEWDINYHYSDLSVKNIGSPLHCQLEDIILQRNDLRKQINPDDKFILAVFVSAQHRESCIELIQQASCVVRFLNKDRLLVLLNCHDIAKKFMNDIQSIIDDWSNDGVEVIYDVEQTEMIAVSNLVFTSPLSTTATRALHAHTPVLVCFGSETQIDVLLIIGSTNIDFPFVPELICGSILYVEMENDVNADFIEEVVNNSMNGYQKAQEAGLICPSDAMSSLVDLVLEQL